MMRETKTKRTRKKNIMRKRMRFKKRNTKQKRMRKMTMNTLTRTMRRTKTVVTAAERWVLWAVPPGFNS